MLDYAANSGVGPTHSGRSASVAGTARKIRIVGDPVLRARCPAVTSFDADLEQLIEDMTASMHAADGVGLAAPQIGVELAVFVYDCPDASGQHQRGHLVNPQLVSTSAELDEGEEGCLSVPGPYETLPRPAVATVQGSDRHGKPIEVTGTGFLARCLQHETEHLSGLLYIDHLPRNRRRRVLREMVPFEWNAPPPSS
jgi:peptide deformylase